MVAYTTHGRVARITLDRPEKRNALNGAVTTALQQAFERAAADDAVRAVVLAAEGPVFCAGADLEYLVQLQRNSHEENLADSKRLARLFETIYTLPKPVAARVQGHALAGGCGLATVCDFAFAVPEAKFGYTEARIGFVPAIVSYFLAHKIGEGRARELLLTGRLLTAGEAQAWGLVNYAVPAAELDARLGGFLDELLRQNAGQSLALTKRLLADMRHLSLPDALRLAAETNARARATPDCRRGMAAFVNKQDITW